MDRAPRSEKPASNLRQVRDLLQAAAKGDLAAVRQFVEEAGVDVNAANPRGRTALIAATEGGNVELVEYLLDNGADPNVAQRDNLHSTLHVAVLKEHLGMVKRLVEAGADLNFADIHESTPLTTAARIHHLETVEYLLWRGSDVNTLNQYMLSPLMFAVLGGAEEIVEQLLKAGADVNAIGQNGMSALIFAACHDHRGVAERLVKAGGDVTVVDQSGKAALDWAEENGKHAVAEFLRSVSR